ncbi:auxin-responsive protein SAUR68-like [Solanum stenotomum]|uniref:auxin-responsive protein SAUR68-like n=1 Tax=Solanum stenotomum TaxID=172797 RepID=UPI0020D02B89|nr:auxin-responsive protein SAUR68-like [Solanum stenotomum]
MNRISATKLVKMARQWQKFAAKQRQRISFPRSNYNDAESCSTSSSIVSKGNFVVYTTDQKRFVVPLAYLQHEVIRQLLHMSEEEFGLPCDGPITLPCDALFMNYIVSLIERGVGADLQNALLVSVSSSQCSSALYLQEQRNLQLLVC